MDLIALGIAVQNGKKTGAFTYNTDIGLRKWKAALAKVKSGATQIVDLVFTGDSITEGYTTSDPVNKSHVGRIRTALQSKYGDVGKGYLPSYFPYGLSSIWTYTGTWRADGFGTGMSNKVSTALNDTATINFNGTGIKLLFVAGSTGTFSATIDGGAAQNFDTYNATLILEKEFSITGLADGSHTCVITNTSTGANKELFLLGAVEIKGTSGIRVSMCGKWGSTSTSHSSDRSLAISADYFHPALTVIGLVANDSSAATTLSTYKTNIQAIITKALTYGDVLMVSSGMHAPAVANESLYIQAFKDLTLINNCAYLDLAGRWGNSGDYAKTTLGFITDDVHPNDIGQQDIATAILRIIDEY